MSILCRYFFYLVLVGMVVLILLEVFVQDIELIMVCVKCIGKLCLGVINGVIFYFNKDLVMQEWKGFCVDFGCDLVCYFKVEVEWVEIIWGNVVLDVQINKIDV